MRKALILAALISLTACGFGNPPAADVSPGTASGTPASGPRISPPSVTPPTPPGTNLPAFACANASGGAAGMANTVAARLSEQPGFDRFVLQLDSMVPTFAVVRQASATFSAGASGQSVTLLGTVGVLLTVHSATGASTFTGPLDLQHPEYQVLLEARQIQDFEGYVSWALGLSRNACMRVFTLTDPPRIVIDFTTATTS